MNTSKKTPATFANRGRILNCQDSAQEEHSRASHTEAEQFHVLVNAVQDCAVFMIDPKGRIATWNDGAERIKGYKASEVIGRHYSCFFSEEDLKSRKPDIHLEIAAQKGIFQGEGWRVRKDGSRFWASVVLTAIRDKSEKLVGFAKVTRDSTELMETARALRESEARYRAVVETAADAIVTTGADTRIRFVNPAATRIFGYSYAELIGHELALIIPASPKRFHGTPTVDWCLTECFGRRQNGDQFPLEVSMGESMQDGTEIYICFLKDISLRKQSEQKLSESEKSLRNLSLYLLASQDEERRRIGRELHDSLGQSLVAMKMNLDSLASSTAPGKNEAGSQLAECRRLAENVIQELRTIAYLMYPPMLDELGLRAAVSWYLEGFAQRSQIATTLEVEPDFGRLPPEVELAMFRVLQESLTNVHRHSGSATARVRLLIKENTAQMEVTDYGKGITPTPSGERGFMAMTTLGVGLRGMGERVSQLGGNLAVSSTPTGTTVAVSIPIRRDPSAAAT